MSDSRPKEGIRSSETGDIVVCETPDVDIENLSWVLCKSRISIGDDLLHRNKYQNYGDDLQCKCEDQKSSDPE
ncbi:hypothetical protein STEG23_008180 [Scotinomys teguina]